MGTGRRWGLVALAAAASLLLSACLLMPGNFTASLDLRRDGTFTYRYDGEVVMLGLTKLAQAERNPPFMARPCWRPARADELDSKPAEPLRVAPPAGQVPQVERPCNSTELDQQRRDWEREKSLHTLANQRRDEQAKAFLGGIDPTDPKSATELADRLRRQAGWKRAEYKGDGVYLVSFEASGRLDHDFTFPTIERLPMANAFVTVIRRADGVVRIDAPGFSQAGLGAFGPMMGMMGAMEAGAAKGGPPLPTANGRFTLTTDGTVLANNTDEGPRATANGQALEWLVNPHSAAAPMALVKLGQ